MFYRASITGPFSATCDFAYSKAPFTLLRLCYDAFLLHQRYPFTLLRVCTKMEGKNPFLCAHIDLPDNKYGAKDIRFLCVHIALDNVKLIVGYYSVFKNLRFCAFTLVKCFLKSLRFRGYPLLIAFSKTSVFVAFLCRSV